MIHPPQMAVGLAGDSAPDKGSSITCFNISCSTLVENRCLSGSDPISSVGLLSLT